MDLKDNEFIIHFSNSFKGIRIIEDALYATEWHLKADIFPDETTDNHKFNLGLTKIKFWFEQLVEDSIVFSGLNQWAIDSFVGKSANIPIVCPGEPTDDILTLLLQSKMNALADNAFTVGYVDLKSDSNNGLSFIYIGDTPPNLPSMSEWIGERSYFDQPWWARDDASTLDVVPDEDGDLDEIPEFAFKLDFLEEAIPEMPAQPAKIIRPTFTPKVIKGKKV